MAIIDQNGKVQKEEKRRAFILAIGTSNPSNYMLQADYPDYYFRITDSEDMIDLKKKFKRICDNTTIKKRHMYLTEEILKKNPDMCDFMAPSLDARLDIVGAEVPKLSKEAAEKAIEEWGQPKSQITHLVFCTAMGAGMPGADYELIKLLGLNQSVMRVTMYLQGCNAGGTALRVAKDIAENNKGARVLVVCCEMNVLQFRGPSSTHFESLICQSLFGDGAAALIVGADHPDSTKIEHPLFQLVSASQTLIPETGNGVGGSLREFGLTFYLSKKLPHIISKNLTSCLVNAFTPLGINDWNSIFWITHPGGPAILDQVEANLGLNEGKLRASRHVLREYGNLSSASVLFIMDEMRRKSLADGKATTGEGHEYGVLFGFGPGLNVDTIVLRSVPFATDIESTAPLLF